MLKGGLKYLSQGSLKLVKEKKNEKDAWGTMGQK